jgi:hypothetical protein
VQRGELLKQGPDRIKEHGLNGLFLLEGAGLSGTQQKLADVAGHRAHLQPGQGSSPRAHLKIDTFGRLGGRVTR